MEPQEIVDVAFPVKGRSLPLDHGYLLFTALCEHVPKLMHEPEWGVHPVQGKRESPCRLSLLGHSKVQLRVPARHLGEVLRLGIKALHVGAHRMQLGVASVQPLQPSAQLRAHCVVMHGHQKAERFEEALRYELMRMDLLQPIDSIEIDVGDRKYIKTRAHVVPGFEVILSNLEPHASLLLQAFGVGGRRYLGLGVFVPHCPEPTPAAPT